MLCIGKTYVFKDEDSKKRYFDRYESNELVYNRYYKDGFIIDRLSPIGTGLIKETAVISRSEEKYFIEKLEMNLKPNTTYKFKDAEASIKYRKSNYNEQCFQYHYFSGFKLDEVIDGNGLINGKVVISPKEIPLFVEEEPSLKPNPELNNLVEIDGIIHVILEDYKGNKFAASSHSYTTDLSNAKPQKPAPLEEIQSYDHSA